MNVVCDLYKPCAALLIVLVSLYFFVVVLFSHFGSSDITN